MAGVMESVQNDLGKTTIFPKPELRRFLGEFPYFSPPFGVTTRQEMVAIIRWFNELGNFRSKDWWEFHGNLIYDEGMELPRGKQLVFYQVRTLHRVQHLDVPGS